jgi:hypothetical protein
MAMVLPFALTAQSQSGCGPDIHHFSTDFQGLRLRELRAPIT